MKRCLLLVLAVCGVWLGLSAAPASAAWAYRTAYRYDPACGRYVAFQQRYWVADPCHTPRFHHPRRPVIVRPAAPVVIDRALYPPSHCR